MIKLTFSIGALALLSLLSIPVTTISAQQSLEQLRTVAEASDYQATSLSHEVVEFVDACATVPHVTRYDFGQTVDQRPMVSALVANPPIENVRSADDSRLRILLLGNIHSGECSGKEALLSILRELARDSAHPWLQHVIVVIAPNYNADANDRVGTGHRPGQIGPVAGMGLRENMMGLDLNRDFMKLQSPEARALVQLMNDFQPHMFIDCHTTNGSEHQYKLTYDIPHNPSVHPAIRDYLRNRMMPAITESLKQEKGLLTFYYGNFNPDHTEWTTFGDEPRYSTEYAGLRGILGILSEDYSYATYQERIESTDAFVRQCVAQLIQDREQIVPLLADIRQTDARIASSSPDQLLVHLKSRMTGFPEPFTVSGFKDGVPHDYQVRFVGNYEPAYSVSAPWGYLIPREFSQQAELLRMHGIQLEELKTDTSVDVTIPCPVSIQPERFQGLAMQAVQCRVRQENRLIPAGTWVVRTGQPLARLIVYLLEPESNDGLVAWKYFDSHLGKDEDLPILRVDKPQSLELLPVTEIPPGRKLELADIFGPSRLELADPQLDQVRWSTDGKSYFVDRPRRVAMVDAATGGEARFEHPVDNVRLVAAFETLEGIGQNEIAAFLSRDDSLRVPNQTMFVFAHEKRIFFFDAVRDIVHEPGTESAPVELAEVDPTGSRVAWVQGNDLYVLESGKSPGRLTTDGSEKVLNGKLDWVYQEELYGRGNFKAFWWSPDGESLAWLRTDESPVRIYTVVDHLPVPGNVEATPYPKAGDPLPHVRLHTFHLKSLESRAWPVPSMAGEAGEEGLISRVTWDHTDRTLMVQIQNRTQTWLDLKRIDPVANTVTPLFRDSTPAWIASPGEPVILEDGSFLWLSPRSGFRSIYHYAHDGSLIRPLLEKEWEVRSLEGCDFPNRLVYFSGCPASPFRTQLMKVSLDGGEPEILVDRPGSQSAKFNADFQWFLCEHSAMDTPDSISLFRADGTFVRTVVANRPDWIHHIDVGEMEPVEIPVTADSAAQGSIIDALIMKPSNFSADRKWPVILHVYGGPQAPRIRDRFAGQGGLFHQYLVQQGFVVVLVDNRSASWRATSQAWPVHRNLAKGELADLLTAVEWLKATGWVEESRIGLWGWSYGGYLTAYAMTHSKVFAAGVAGGPVTDWRNYDAIYTERYMLTPQENPEGYATSSVLKAAPNLSGNLLLIHGTMDDNVHVSNTLQLADALQKAGKQFELMLYPGNRHAVRDPDQQLHMHTLMSDFFRRHLQQ